MLFEVSILYYLQSPKQSFRRLPRRSDYCTQGKLDVNGSKMNSSS